MDRYAVGSFGHSGTLWLSRALSFAGLPTTHEAVFTLPRRRLPWPPGLAGDVSLAATLYLDELEPTVGRYFLTRELLDVVNSYRRGWMLSEVCPCGHPPGAHRLTPFARYAAELGADLEAPELEALAGYLVGSAEAAIKADAVFLRVEDLTAGVLAGLALELGAEPTNADALVDLEAELLTTDANLHPSIVHARLEVGWAELLEHPSGRRLAGLAADLGYPAP